MKVLKTLGIIVLVLVAIVVIVPAFLPSTKFISRSITVNAPAKNAFVMVNDLKNWTKWSPWYLMDTTSNMVYSENPVGKDAWYEWDSKKSDIGKGKLTITNSAPSDSVNVEIAMENMDPFHAGYYFETVGENETKVTTSMMMTSPNYIGKWFIVLFSGNLANQFDKGLAKIKEGAESMEIAPEAPAGVVEAVMEETMPSMTYLYVTDTVPSSEISKSLGENYGAIMTFIKEKEIQIMGAPFAIYLAYDPDGNTAMQPAIPVAEGSKGNDMIMVNTTQPQLVLSVNFYGPYDNSGIAHDAIYAFAEQNGYEMAGSPWESYITDPSEEKDPSKWLTKVSYPVVKKAADDSAKEEMN